ncbi:MAG: hypothetical protein ACRD5W_07715, partial [Candidatus Acidiferrales bacterium]
GAGNQDAHERTPNSELRTHTTPTEKMAECRGQNAGETLHSRRRQAGVPVLPGLTLRCAGRKRQGFPAGCEGQARAERRIVSDNWKTTEGSGEVNPSKRWRWPQRLVVLKPAKLFRLA